VLVDEIGPLCPVFAHGYDYFVPSSRAVKIFPACPARAVGAPRDAPPRGGHHRPGAPARDRPGDDRRVQRRRARRARALARGAFAHLDLRGTLDPDKDWENEIHATRRGNEALAKRFLQQLDAKLPAVRKARAARFGGVIA
jgi:hypothetical protein